MTIPTAAQLTPIPAINARVALVSREGVLTSEAMATLDKWRAYGLGAGRLIPCHATGTNVITLLPTDASPTLEGYRFGDAFLFWAENNSTGAVTAKVKPKSTSTYTLATIKVYITNGSAQAGAGDVVANSVYVAYFAPHLDSNAGGLVLK